MAFVVGTIRIVACYAGSNSAGIVLLLLAVIALCGAILAMLFFNASTFRLTFLLIIGYVRIYWAARVFLAVNLSNCRDWICLFISKNLLNC